MSDLTRFLRTVAELTRAGDEVLVGTIANRLQWSEGRIRPVVEHAYDTNLIEADAELDTGVVSVDGLTPLGRIAALT